MSFLLEDTNELDGEIQSQISHLDLVQMSFLVHQNWRNIIDHQLHSVEICNVGVCGRGKLILHLGISQNQRY